MAAIRIQHLALGIALAVTSAGCSSWRPPVVVGAAYHHEPSQVIAVLEEVARQHEKVLQYPPPQAFTVDFADS